MCKCIHRATVEVEEPPSSSPSGPAQRQEKPWDGGVDEGEQVWRFTSDCVPIKACLRDVDELPRQKHGGFGFDT